MRKIQSGGSLTSIFNFWSTLDLDCFIEPNHANLIEKSGKDQAKYLLLLQIEDFTEILIK